jgi:hypothetical protein
MKLETIVNDIISESDKRTSIQNALGFSEAWANEFHSINPKLSVWIASTFITDFLKNKMSSLDNFIKSSKVDPNKSKEAVLKFLNQQGPGFAIWRNDYKPNYRYVMDWFVSPRRREHVNIKTLSFDDALQKSTEWHESLEDKISIGYEEKNKVFIDYRDANGLGFYWVDLKTDFSQEESDRMGHCGRDSGCTLFSLRSSNDIGESRSHITASYRSKDNRLEQIKGRKNSKPKQVYYKYIMDLLVNQEYPVDGMFKKIYGLENNFKLSDLTTDQLNDIFSKNKNLKIDYLFGDKKKINVNRTDSNIVLFHEDQTDGYYGIVNTDTTQILKDYEYVIDENSQYTEFLHFPKNEKIIVLKHFVSVKSKDNFIIRISNRLFDFIDKDEADKILSSNEWEDLESWYETKQKKES